VEVHFTPDLQAKLSRVPTEQGRDVPRILQICKIGSPALLFRQLSEPPRDAATLVQEAVERLVDYDDRFLREVEKGLAAADRGEFIEHDGVRKLIDTRYAG
jgi:hypothetical protein